MPVSQITPQELKARLDSGEQIPLIDVREPSERSVGSIGGVLIPLSEVLSRVAEIPREGPVVVYCRVGGRSSRAIEELQKLHHYTNLINLAGGILRWREEVDPSLPLL